MKVFTITPISSRASGLAIRRKEKEKVMSQKQLPNSFTLAMDPTPGNVPQKVSDDSPGRFFAVNEMKLMLAFILLRYDVKTKDGKLPEATKFMGFLLPPTKAEILFRKRSI
jgi:hypothetical protein